MYEFRLCPWVKNSFGGSGIEANSHCHLLTSHESPILGTWRIHRQQVQHTALETKRAEFDSLIPWLLCIFAQVGEYLIVFFCKGKTIPPLWGYHISWLIWHTVPSTCLTNVVIVTYIINIITLFFTNQYMWYRTKNGHLHIQWFCIIYAKVHFYCNLLKDDCTDLLYFSVRICYFPQCSVRVFLCGF